MLRRVDFLILLLSIISTVGISFIVLPIIALFLLVDPDILVRSFLKEPSLFMEARHAFITTIEASLLSTILLLFLGIPLAYILARMDFPFKSLIEGIIDIPLMIPHTIAGIMILCAYGRRGLLKGLMNTLNISIEDAFLGIVLVMMFVSFPLIVDTIKVGIMAVDPMLEMVARGLGATRFRAFITITLPLSYRSILAGAILAWARALSEVGAILVVAYFPKTANILTLEWLNVYGLKYAVAISIPLVLLALSLFIALRLLVRAK
ncbi:MAG: tungstate/molybdate transporter permease [Thermoprotei archaeon]|nr:MAG: tungstate/molybdate transporter permease [Thermoprotei archaeon]RLF18191.1 MAG: tungstate/molybdate transporter permease [Thermoprotei archaeon]